MSSALVGSPQPSKSLIDNAPRLIADEPAGTYMYSPRVVPSRGSCSYSSHPKPEIGWTSETFIPPVFSIAQSGVVQFETYLHAVADGTRTLSREDVPFIENITSIMTARSDVEHEYKGAPQLVPRSKRPLLLSLSIFVNAPSTAPQH